MILQRTGDDLRCRRGSAVDEHDHRHRLDRGRQIAQVVFASAAQIVVLARGQAHARVGGAAVGVDDQRVPGQESCGDADRRGQQSTRVGAHVQHQADELALLVQALNRLGEILSRALLELTNADVAVTGLEHLGLHALDDDFLARQREGQRGVELLAGNGKDDLRSRFAAHFLYRVGERHAAGCDVVDLDDQVARLDPGAERRRVFDRRDHFDDAVFDADFDAEPAESALGRHLQLAESLGVEEVRVRVEPVDHAVDGFADQLVVGNRLDVIALDPAEDRGEELQIVIRDRQPGFLFRHRREIEAQQQAEHCPQTDQSRLLPAVAHRKPLFRYGDPRMRIAKTLLCTRLYAGFPARKPAGLRAGRDFLGSIDRARRQIVDDSIEPRTVMMSKMPSARRGRAAGAT